MKKANTFSIFEPLKQKMLGIVELPTRQMTLNLSSNMLDILCLSGEVRVAEKRLKTFVVDETNN